MPCVNGRDMKKWKHSSQRVYSLLLFETNNHSSHLNSKVITSTCYVLKETVSNKLRKNLANIDVKLVMLSIYHVTIKQKSTSTLENL